MYVLCLLKAILITIVLDYVFYRSVIVLLFLFPVTIILFRDFLLKKSKDYQREVETQFCDGIRSLAASLRAGHSAENAFEDAAGELCRLYGTDAPLSRAFRGIGVKRKLNIPLETAVMEMAQGFENEDMETFALVFRTARRSGGELGSVIRESVQTIGTRLEVREEIRTMLQGKTFEQKVMKVIPVILLLYMDFSSEGYFDVLYQTAAGRLMMTVCLLLYLGAWVLSERIADIAV